MSTGEMVARDRRFPVSADVRLTSEQGDFAELIAIDISLAGVGIDGLIHFPPETRVRIEFPNGKQRTGCTRWRDTFTSGAAFDVPMTESELNALWTALRNQPRFPARAPLPKAAAS